MEENYPSERHHALSDAIEARDWAKARTLIPGFHSASSPKMTKA